MPSTTELFGMIAFAVVLSIALAMISALRRKKPFIRVIKCGRTLGSYQDTDFAIEELFALLQSSIDYNDHLVVESCPGHLALHRIRHTMNGEAVVHKNDLVFTGTVYLVTCVTAWLQDARQQSDNYKALFVQPR